MAPAGRLADVLPVCAHDSDFLLLLPAAPPNPDAHPSWRDLVTHALAEADRGLRTNAGTTTSQPRLEGRAPQARCRPGAGRRAPQPLPPLRTPTNAPRAAPRARRVAGRARSHTCARARDPLLARAIRPAACVSMARFFPPERARAGGAATQSRFSSSGSIFRIAESISNPDWTPPETDVIQVELPWNPFRGRSDARHPDRAAGGAAGTALAPGIVVSPAFDAFRARFRPNANRAI